MTATIEPDETQETAQPPHVEINPIGEAGPLCALDLDRIADSLSGRTAPKILVCGDTAEDSALRIAERISPAQLPDIICLSERPGDPHISARLDLLAGRGVRVLRQTGRFTGATTPSRQSAASAEGVGRALCDQHGPFDLILVDPASDAQRRFSDIRLAAASLTPGGAVVLRGAVGPEGAQVRAAIFEFLRFHPDFSFVHPSLSRMDGDTGLLISDGLAIRPSGPGAMASADERARNALADQARHLIAERIAIEVSVAPLLIATSERGLLIDPAELDERNVDVLADKIIRRLEREDDPVLFSADLLDTAPDELLARLFAWAAERRIGVLFYVHPPGEAGVAGPRSRPVARILDLAASQGLAGYAPAGLEVEAARARLLDAQVRLPATSLVFFAARGGWRDMSGRSLVEVSPAMAALREQAELQGLYTTARERLKVEQERRSAEQLLAEAVQLEAGLARTRSASTVELAHMRDEISQLRTLNVWLDEDRRAAIDHASAETAQLREKIDALESELSETLISLETARSEARERTADLESRLAKQTASEYASRVSFLSEQSSLRSAIAQLDTAAKSDAAALATQMRKAADAEGIIAESRQRIERLEKALAGSSAEAQSHARRALEMEAALAAERSARDADRRDAEAREQDLLDGFGALLAAFERDRQAFVAAPAPGGEHPGVAALRQRLVGTSHQFDRSVEALTLQSQARLDEHARALEAAQQAQALAEARHRAERSAIEDASAQRIFVLEEDIRRIRHDAAETAQRQESEIDQLAHLAEANAAALSRLSGLAPAPPEPGDAMERLRLALILQDGRLAGLEQRLNRRTGDAASSPEGLLGKIAGYLSAARLWAGERLNALHVELEVRRLLSIEETLQKQCTPYGLIISLFDTEYYAQQGGPPHRAFALRHYVREGEAAGLKPLRLFDPAHYRSGLGDARRPVGSLLRHFLTRGLFEGRSPHEGVAGLEVDQSDPGRTLAQFFEAEEASRGSA